MNCECRSMVCTKLLKGGATGNRVLSSSKETNISLAFFPRAWDSSRPTLQSTKDMSHNLYLPANEYMFFCFIFLVIFSILTLALLSIPGIQGSSQYNSIKINNELQFIKSNYESSSKNKIKWLALPKCLKKPSTDSSLLRGGNPITVGHLSYSEGGPWCKPSPDYYKGFIPKKAQCDIYWI